MAYARISVNPEQMGDVPCIRGLRIPVATVVSMVAEGMTETEILEAYPDLEAGIFARHSSTRLMHYRSGRFPWQPPRNVFYRFYCAAPFPH